MAIKVVSCGVLIVGDGAGDGDQLFTCHATGTSRWDLPKGIGEPGESPRETALREAWEETSLRLPPDALQELGLFDYLPAKRLHLFALRVAPGAFDPAGCRCHSTFEHSSGRVIPEVDRYAWQPLARLETWCGKNLSRVLAGVDRARLAGMPPVAEISITDEPPPMRGAAR